MAITQPRRSIQIRLSEAGLAAVDKLAEEEQRSRSEMIRRLVAEAVTRRVREAKS